MTLDKNAVIKDTVKVAQELHQKDQDFLREHKENILRMAEANDDPVEISCYLAQKHNINIRISALRSFLTIANLSISHHEN